MKSDTTILHLGLDVHQETIAVAIASGDGSLRHYGEIPGYLQAVDTLIKKLQMPGTELLFCHEAGPRGFVLSRRRKHRERKNFQEKIQITPGPVLTTLT